MFEKRESDSTKVSLTKRFSMPYAPVLRMFASPRPKHNETHQEFTKCTSENDRVRKNSVSVNNNAEFPLNTRSRVAKIQGFYEKNSFAMQRRKEKLPCSRTAMSPQLPLTAMPQRMAAFF